MGTSTNANAILVYGYNLGGVEDWKIDGADDYELPDLPWLTVDDHSDEADQFITQAEARLTEVLGKGHGVKFVWHCSVDYPMWILAAYDVTAPRGYPQHIDFRTLAGQQREEQWAAQLRRALEALDITPTGQPSPCWWLASDMG